MRKLGYIYRPAIMPPSQKEQLLLQQSGATETVVDLGDRHHYINLVQQYGSAEAADLRLYVLSLTDLGETAPKVEQQVQFWLQRGAELWVVTEDGAQSLGDREVLETWLAQLPQELKGRHIAEGHAQNRLNRKPPPGPAPFGYRRVGNTYELDEQPAQLVRAFFDRFLLFGSIRGAVKDINQERADTISVTTARRWLSSPVYRGDLKFKDGVTLRDTHPALLSREEAAQIDRWSRRNSPIASRSTSAPRALAGLVVCQTCDRPLRIVQATRKNQAKVYRYLRCTTCRYSVNYELALTNTIQAVCQQLPERTSNLDSVPIDSIKSRIELQIERNKVEIVTLDTEPAPEEMPTESDRDRQLQRYLLEGENAKLGEKRDQLPPGNLAAIAQAVSIEPFWRALSESEQRAYLREFIKQISINSDAEVKLEFFF
ncbi:MAG: recombinase family protein [Cyanobacteria bacterium P01_E01_bin.45]